MLSRLLRAVAGGMFAAMLSITVQAQPAPGAAKTTDCSKARDPERCQARLAATAACQDKRGAARRQCIEGHMPPPDCGKSPNPARCSAMLAAREACKDKVGPAHRQCMREQAKATAPAAKP